MYILERALRALASSSGGAACPGGYPGSTPGVNQKSRGMIPRRYKRKKNFVTDGGRTDGRTDVKVEIVV